MSHGARVPATPMTGMYGGLIRLAMRKILGKVPESAEVMWNNPAVFKDMMKFGGRVEKWDRLDPDLATFAAMATAAHVGCGACLDLQYFLSRRKGLDEARAREVPRWRQSDVFTPGERRVMEYAEAVSSTPPTVTDELSAALLADLGPAALLELTARIATMNMAARSNIALGIRSEEYAASCGLPPLTAASDVASTA